MKKATVLIGIVCLMATTLYAQRHGREAGQSRSRSDSIEDQGRREADNFWRSYVASCKGATYMRAGSSQFIELRGFRVQMDYESLSEADRLNGVQAKGYSRIKAITHRVYTDWKWHEWKNGLPQGFLADVVRFEKKSGSWIFRGVGYFERFAQKIVCSDVPGFVDVGQKETPTNYIDISSTHRFPIESFSFLTLASNETGDRFPQSLTTYINWRIRYSDTAFWYSLPNVEHYWYRNGKQQAYYENAVVPGYGKGYIWGRHGWAEPGKWETGEYTVKIYLRKKLVAKASFEIVHDDLLPKQIRFDGLYRLVQSQDIVWFRFYEDSRYLFTSSPKDVKLDKMGICLSSVRNKYAAGCDDFDVREGKWIIHTEPTIWISDLLSINEKVVGHNVLKLGLFDEKYVFIKPDRLCPTYGCN